MTLDKIISENDLTKFNNPTKRAKKDINFNNLKYFKYLEISHYWYDDEENSDLNNWSDVEGIGYGWLWCSTKLRSKFIYLQRRALKKYILNIIKDINKNTKIITYSNDDIYHIGFMSEDNDCYIEIRMSNNKTLYY